MYIYINISVFKLPILLKKNYTKHNVSRLMTILSGRNSLNIYIYLDLAYNPSLMLFRMWTRIPGMTGFIF